MKKMEHWELQLDDEVIACLKRLSSLPLHRPSEADCTESLTPEQAAVLRLASQDLSQGLIGTPMIGDFCLEETIGEGTFGKVYRARKVTGDETVALKVLKEEPGIEDAELSLPEFPEGTAIVRPTFVGRTPTGLIFFTMRHMGGGSLKSRIDAHPLGLGFEEALRVVKAVAATLVPVHKELVHLDLKPENILFDSGDRPFVADLGLAVRRKSLHRLRDSVGGTLAYMAPEVLDGLSRTPTTPGATADIYAVGVLFYEMLTGRYPKGESTSDKSSILANYKVPPDAPRALDPSIPAEVSELCMRCLHRDRSRRPQSALDLLEAIDEINNRRKRRYLFVVLGVIALGLMGATIGNRMQEPSHVNRVAAARRIEHLCGAGAMRKGPNVDESTRISRLENVRVIIIEEFKGPGLTRDELALIAAAARTDEGSEEDLVEAVYKLCAAR